MSAPLRNIEKTQGKGREFPLEIVAANAAERTGGAVRNFDSPYADARSAVLHELAASEDDLASNASGPSVTTDGIVMPAAEPDDRPDSAEALPARSMEQYLSTQPLPSRTLAQHLPESRQKQSFHWNTALKQSLIFLGIQQGFRFATENSTRAYVKGRFFKNYIKTLKSLRGWNDGDPFIVNYIGHPLMGAVTGFIQIRNDPNGIGEQVGLKRSYFRSRLKAFAWSFVYSTQFEIGPVSEASIGNVGLRPYGHAKHPMAYVDIVVTPIVGTGWLIGEDLLDRYLLQRLEGKIGNRGVQNVLRAALNPGRSFSNMIQGEYPWHRDNRE
ncbi:MAG: hypothetical protein C5B57_05115 [Blastocatellia bacterium]|nr:MAG: hypothetical protein C5B57_05115 [Blastocatellia bacterium]